MNRQEVEELLKESKEKQAELTRLISNLERVLEERSIPDLPEFAKGETAWVSDQQFEDIEDFLVVEPVSDFNSFHNQAYAKMCADRCKLVAMLLHCKWYLCRNYMPDWENQDESKWFVYFHHDDQLYVDYAVADEDVHGVYFDTEENAKRAADWVRTHYDRK